MGYLKVHGDLGNMPTKFVRRYELVDVQVEQPSRLETARHMRYIRGQQDRIAGKPCMSDKGAYLNGWYAPHAGPYYVTEAQVSLYIAPYFISKGLARSMAP